MPAIAAFGDHGAVAMLLLAGSATSWVAIPTLSLVLQTDPGHILAELRQYALSPGRPSNTVQAAEDEAKRGAANNSPRFGARFFGRMQIRPNARAPPR